MVVNLMLDNEIAKELLLGKNCDNCVYQKISQWTTMCMSPTYVIKTKCSEVTHCESFKWREDGAGFNS